MPVIPVDPVNHGKAFPEHRPAGEPMIQSQIRKFSPNAVAPLEDDWVAAEAPLEVRIGGRPATVLMRTPEHDEELVRGFLFSEGIISAAADILSIEPLPAASTQVGGSAVAVELASSKKSAGKSLAAERSFFSNSSCGVCGKRTIASLEVRGNIADARFTVRRSTLGAMPERLRSAQTTFAKTGGVHASGLFTPAGELVALREDVGRHNALDKVIGWALQEGKIPLQDFVLLVSGRVSYELVQKSIVASIPFIAAVGAPSSLAVDLAQHFGITLVGFLRPDGMNVYAHAQRIAD